MCSANHLYEGPPFGLIEASHVYCASLANEFETEPTIAKLKPEYIARMEDVLALYEKPLAETEPVVCMDEKPVVLHADVRSPHPMRRAYALAARRKGETLFDGLKKGQSSRNRRNSKCRSVAASRFGIVERGICLGEYGLQRDI